jgi:hypothetical protein
LLGHIKTFAYLGVRFAHYPQCGTRELQRGAAGWVQGGMGRRHKAHARDVQAPHECLHDAFEVCKAKVGWRLTIVPRGRQHRTSQGDGQAALL